MRTTLGMMMLLAGCVEADEDGAVNVGEDTQAVTDWSYPFFSGADLDLGPTSDKTCFLQGVKGSLRGAMSWQDDDLKTASGGVFMSSSDNHWHIRTKPGSGAGFAVKVGCITNVANRVTISADNLNNLDTALVTSNRRCFLTSVFGHGMGWMANVDNQPNDPPGVALLPNAPGPSWRIEVGLIENGSTLNNGRLEGGASAVCVDVPNGNAIDFTYSNLGGSVTLPIAPSRVAEYTCGLSRIIGVIDHGISERGIELFHDGTPDWLLSLRSGYTTTARCVR